MRIVSIVVVLLFAACVAGCEQQSAQADVVATPINHAQKRVMWNTDPGEAVGIATRIMRDEGFGEDEYGIAGASFDDQLGEWQVVFPHTPRRHDFDEMMVIVNDLDRSAKIVTNE